MSSRGDYFDEMRNQRHLDDDAIDAALAGDAREGMVERFVGDVDLVASGPVPVPSALLATMLASGFSTENGDLSATAVSNVTGASVQAAGLPKRRRRMPIPQFIAGLSLFGKVALGVGVAAAATGGAGAAGALPDPVQHAVASTVDTVTPFSFPDKANGHADFGNRTSTDAHDETPGVDGQKVSTDARNKPNKPATTEKPDATGSTGSGAATGATGAADHGLGGTVSADAKDGGVDGATVSADAKAQQHPTGATGAAHASGPAGATTSSSTTTTMIAPSVSSSPSKAHVSR